MLARVSEHGAEDSALVAHHEHETELVRALCWMDMLSRTHFADHHVWHLHPFVLHSGLVPCFSAARPLSERIGRGESIAGHVQALCYTHNTSTMGVTRYIGFRSDGRYG